MGPVRSASAPRAAAHDQPVCLCQLPLVFARVLVYDASIIVIDTLTYSMDEQPEAQLEHTA
jgi:hypothetical protein